jgi:hypothetical protein
MKSTTLFLLNLLFVFCFTACGDSPSGQAEAAPDQPTARASSDWADQLTTPCELLTADLLQAQLQVPADSLKNEFDDFAGTFMCTWTWNKANLAEIEEKNVQLVQQKVSASMKGESTQDMKFLPTENQITLTTLDRKFKDAATADRAFDAMIAQLSKGVTGSHDDVEMTFQAEMDQDVKGVGDRAVWSDQLSQLSIRSGKHIMHLLVTVKDTPAENLALAKQLAQAMLG